MGMISYISVSVNLPQKQIVISFDRKSGRKKEDPMPVVLPSTAGGEAYAPKNN
jgi:hypothetical protein